MLKHLSEVKEIIFNGYQYLITPLGVSGVPITMRKLETVDENGNNTGYASLDGVSEAFGVFYQPQDVIKDGFRADRWSFDEDGEEKENFILLLESKKLVNMRPKGTKIETIDWANFPANGFFVCSKREFKLVPRVVSEEEV